MTTRKTRLNTESPTPNSGSDSAPSTPSATRKRLVRKINETGKLDDKDENNKTNSPIRASRPRINRNSLVETPKSPVAVKVRRKVQSTSGTGGSGGTSTPDIPDTDLPKKRVRRRNSTGRIEGERKQSERLIKKLRSGKSHKSLMQSPNPDKIKVVRKRLRLKDKTDDDVKLKKITKARKIDKIETASDSELLLPVRRRSDSVSKCSDITDTSSYMDVPLVMLKDTDDTFGSSTITAAAAATPAAVLESQQEDGSNDIPLKEMIKKELILEEAIKQELAAAAATTTTAAANTFDIKTESQPNIAEGVKNIKTEITAQNADSVVKSDIIVEKEKLNKPLIDSEHSNKPTDKKTIEIKDHQLLIDMPILNDSGIGADIITPQSKQTNVGVPPPTATDVPPIIAADTTKIIDAQTVSTSDDKIKNIAALDEKTKTIAADEKTKITASDEKSKPVKTVVKRKRVSKKANAVAGDKPVAVVKQKTIRKPKSAAAVTKAKEKVQANAKLKANIKQRQPLIETTAETISIPLLVQSGPRKVPPPISTVPPATAAITKKDQTAEIATPPAPLPSKTTKSPSPVLMSVGVSEISVKQFYGQPDFLENNLGIEKDPKLGEIVQEKSKLIVTNDLLPVTVAKVLSPPIIMTSSTITEPLSECISTASSTPRKMSSPETDHDSSQEIYPEDRLRIEDSDTAGNSSEGVPTPKKDRITVATTTVETIQTHDRTIIEITTTNGIPNHNRMLGGMASITSQPISVADSIKCVTVTEQRHNERPRATSASTALANLNGTLDKPLSMEVELIPILPTTAIKPTPNINSISVEPIECAAAPVTIVPATTLTSTTATTIQDHHRMTEPDNKENIILNKVKESMIIEENKIVVTPIPQQPTPPPPAPPSQPPASIILPVVVEAKKDLIDIVKKEIIEPTKKPIIINETPELIKQKETLLKTLGLLSHQAAGAAKNANKHKREEAQKSRKPSSEYTGSLKTIIKLPRPTVNSSGSTAAIVSAASAAVNTAASTATVATNVSVNNVLPIGQSATATSMSTNDKKKPVRESLKMTLHKARGKSTTDREQTSNSDGTDTYYTIQNEPTNPSSLIGMGISTATEGANGGQSRKTHYRSHNTSDSALHTIDSSESTAIGAIKEKDDEIVIPEKASSFRIHPGKLCQDQCFYCGGKFGLFDTPCHVAQIKSMERQKKILDNEDKLTVDNCLCDACFRHVDRRANCPSYKKRLSAPSTLTSHQYMNDNMIASQSDTENATTSTTIVTKTTCQVVECTNGATHSVRRKWFMKMRKSIAKLLNLSAEVTSHGNVTMLWVCDQHYDVISHLMVCALCKRKLLRNHIYYITQDTMKLQQMLTGQGIPVAIGTSLVVCKLCRYYSNILLKPPELKSPKLVFAKNYRRRLLQFHNIEIVFDSDTDSQPSEPQRKSRQNKRQRKSSPDSQKSDSDDINRHLLANATTIPSGGGQILLDNDVLVGYDPPSMLMDQSIDTKQPLLAKILPPYPAAVTSILSKPLMTSVTQQQPTNKQQQIPQSLPLPPPPPPSHHHHHHMVQPQPQPQPQLGVHQKDFQAQSKEDISLLRANPNISMRELFPGEEEMGLLVNIPFGSAGLTRTPEGWTKVNTSIQYDEPTRHLWEELQKPYGNQSSFMRHLILLEKYFRQGDLVLSENASGNASIYSTSVQHRLQSFDNRGAAAMSNFLKSSRSSSNVGMTVGNSTPPSMVNAHPMVSIPSHLLKPQKSRQSSTATMPQQPTTATETTSLLKSNYDSRGRPLRYNMSTAKDYRSLSAPRKDVKPETVKCTKTAKIPVGLPPELICINTSAGSKDQPQLQSQQSQVPQAVVQPFQQPQPLIGPMLPSLPLPQHPLKLPSGNDAKKSKHNPSGISVSLSGATNANLSVGPGNISATTIGPIPNMTASIGGRSISAQNPMPEVIRLPEVLSISERNESRNWRPTLMPVTAGPPALNGQLYQTADGRKLPNLVQVQSGGKPYLISIHDYNRMCIVRRERLLRDQMMQQRQTNNALMMPPNSLGSTPPTATSIAEALRAPNQHLQAMAQSVLQNAPPQTSASATSTMTSKNHSLLPPPPPYSSGSGSGGAQKLLPNIIDITSKTPAAPLIPPSPILPAGKIQIPNKILEQNSVIPLATSSPSSLSTSSSATTTSSSKSSTLDSLLKVRKPNSSTQSWLKPKLHQPSSKSTSQSLPQFDSNVISITSTPSISALLGMSPMSDASLPSTSAASLREPQSALDILMKSSSSSANGNSTNTSLIPSASGSSSTTPTTTMPTSSMWLWAESLSNNSSNGSSSTSVGSITVTTTTSAAASTSSSSLASSSSSPLVGIDTAAANLLSKIPKSLTVIPQQKIRNASSNDDVTII